jgi:hypothetical protein
MRSTMSTMNPTTLPVSRNPVLAVDRTVDRAVNEQDE